MVHYQLRRVGKPSTVFGVKDVLKLTKDVTKFGRHSQNDHFLDSAEYMCLISRWHAEIHREYGGGKPKFVLSDNGLNGTFVNDVRVDGSIVIEVGDVVTFGHPNGKKIKPGERSEQTESEFSFLFEKVNEDTTDTISLKTEPTLDYQKEYITHIQSLNNNPEALVNRNLLSHGVKSEGQIDTKHVPQQVLAAVKPELPSLADNVLVTGQVAMDSGVKTSGRSTGDSGRLSNSCHNNANPKLTAAEHSGHSTFILKDISNKNSSQGLVHLDELFANHNKTSMQQAQVNASLNHYNVAAQSGLVSGSSHLRDDGSSLDDSDEDIFTPSVLQHSSQDYLTTQEASTSQKLPVTISQLQMHLQKPSSTAPLYPPLSSILDKPSQLTTSLGTELGGAGQKVKGRRGSAGRKRSLSVRGDEAEEEGGRKKRRKSTAKTAGGGGDTGLMNFTVDHSNEEELPTFHYDGDRCDSYECCQPLASTVSWVQCDDCDKWYHTACAGASYDEVRRTNAEFHCGCTF